MAFRLHNRARMSRALLLATLLAAPTLAFAQTINAGDVTFPNHGDFPMYVNAAECGSHVTVTVKWNPLLLTGFTQIPSNPVYVIWASNVDPRTQTGTAANTCFTTSDTNTGRTVGQVSDATGTDPIITTNAVIDLTDFINKAGKSCSDSGTTVFICVQAQTGGTNFGFAAEAVKISTTIPPPPTITAITPGNGALHVSWDAGSITTTLTGDSYSFQLTADMIATTTAITDPNPHHVSSMFTANDARFDGLVNSVTYAVTATAFSKARNPSPASDAMDGTPQYVNDFWDSYNAAGGRDNGGCAGGPAGPLALGLVAAALGLARRRK